MDTKAVFAALYNICEENATFFSGGAKGPQGDASRRLVVAMNSILEHARSLEPVVSGFAAVYHHFDFDPHIPANGYRSLVKVRFEHFSCILFIGWLFIKHLLPTQITYSFDLCSCMDENSCVSSA